jgi:2-C-methyl-D-erythritol 2,4-cyclodiphosphate synthase
MSGRTGIGYDSHRFEAGTRLVIGGVEIEDAPAGLAGHSDADVLAHAVTDAILGAAGLGDIGQQFPDDDPAWRDADSIGLLARVRAMLDQRGLSVLHLDATVICEAPRLGGRRDAIRARLADATGAEAENVNVKFKTNEGMGFLGRGEGVAALAVATLGEGG